MQSAVESYIAALNARHSRRAGRMVRSDVDNRLSRYVIGRKAGPKREDVPPAPLASVPLRALTENDLRTWRGDLPSKLKETSKKRIGSALRAALKAAYETYRKRLGDALPMVVGLKATETEDDDDIRESRRSCGTSWHRRKGRARSAPAAFVWMASFLSGQIIRR